MYGKLLPHPLPPGFMLSVRISSYGCTREVWRAREKRKSCSGRSREQLWLLECSPNFPSTSMTRYTHAKSMTDQIVLTLLNEIYDEKAENLGEKREKIVD